MNLLDKNLLIDDMLITVYRKGRIFLYNFLYNANKCFLDMYSKLEVQKKNVCVIKMKYNNILVIKKRFIKYLITLFFL